jgi:hypothetical protein
VGPSRSIPRPSRICRDFPFCFRIDASSSSFLNYFITLYIAIVSTSFVSPFNLAFYNLIDGILVCKLAASSLDIEQSSSKPPYHITTDDMTYPTALSNRSEIST